MEIEFVNTTQPDREPVVKQFALKDYAEYIHTPKEKPWLDFFCWADNTTLYKLFNYLPFTDRVSRFTLAPDEKITVKLGLRAYGFFTSLLEYSERPEIQKVMQRGQIWFNDHRRMLIENGITNITRLEDLNESTRIFAQELLEYKERQPLQYSFYRYLLTNMDDDTRKAVLDRLFPQRKTERKDARERRRKERLEALEARRIERERNARKKTFIKELKEACKGPWSFANFIFDNADNIRDFSVEGYTNLNRSFGDVFCRVVDDYITVSSRLYSSHGCSSHHECKVEIGDEDYMERQLKTAFQGCFGNDYSRIGVAHEEFGTVWVDTRNI